MSPLKLLEINVISARDLPPVSKTLRTYAVAWLKPDHRLTTRIDHHGNTNPTWNYKMVFPIDDSVLRSQTSALTIQIYNVVWLRDLPIGTARILIGDLFPLPTRPLALHICRPTGLLQGVLNVAVNLIDNANIGSMRFYDIQNDNKPIDNVSIKNGSLEEEKTNSAEITQLERSRSDQTTTNNNIQDFSPPSDPCSILYRSTTLPSKVSMNSMMRRLPSEVATALTYSFTGGDDLGSSIFDNWTIPADRSNDGTKFRDMVESFPANEELPLTANDQFPLIIKAFEDQKPKLKSQTRKPDGEGLLSCFGNAYGFQFSFVCGSKNAKKNRKKMRNTINLAHSQQKLRRLYM